MRPAFDPLDVPRARFLVAREAWNQSRAQARDPSTFGISFANLFGFWFIDADLIRDVPERVLNAIRERSEAV